MNNRYFAIENLKTALMFSVVLVHIMLPYTTLPRPFKDPSSHITFDLIVLFLYSFVMPAFFLTAGFSAAKLKENKGSKGLWSNRFKRILIPFLVAYFILTPIMRASYDFAKSTVSNNTLSAGIDSVIYGNWLFWTKTYHLWFLLSLLIFTVITTSCLYLYARFNNSKTSKLYFNRLLSSRRALLSVGILLTIMTIPAYIIKGIGTHWSMQFTLLAYFFLGWFLSYNQQIINKLQIYWKALFLLSLSLSPLSIWSSRIRLFQENNIDFVLGAIAGICNGIIGFSMTIALLGIFTKYLNKQSSFSCNLGKSSYWVYLIHFPIVVAVGGAVSLIPVSIFFKFFIVALISIILIYCSYFLKSKYTNLKSALSSKVRVKKRLLAPN